MHLEGRTSIEAALAAGRRRVEVILVKEGSHEEKLADLFAAAERRGVAVKRVAAAELDALAHGRSHGGVVALCRPLKPTSESELLAALGGSAKPPLLLLIDGSEDGRNLGFTLRSAEAFGADAVLLKKHVFDFDETELSRASSGAFERLPLARIDRETELLRELRKRGLELLACVAGAKRTIQEIDLRGPLLLAVGGEKRGLSGAVRDECTRFARIPTASATTSLAMSHAAAVVLAEAARQRGSGAEPSDLEPARPGVE
jgi:23S rRNA (guanosine2251-2'-O)-methyltransferase